MPENVTPKIGMGEAGTLLPVQTANKIFKLVQDKSLALRMMKRLPNMTSNQTELKIEDSLPIAGFVKGDGGLKPVSSMGWAGKTIVAEEIAVIIPFSENVINDANFSIEGETMDAVTGTFASIIDKAAFFGIDKPTKWPMGLIPLAKNKGHMVQLGESYTDQELYKKVTGRDGLYFSVEKDGFPITKVAGDILAQADLRSATDTTGRPLNVGGTDMLGGKPIFFCGENSDAWVDPTTMLLAGDFSQAVYAIRQDLTVKRFTEGVVTDHTGKVVYNLMQNDMVALRFTMRLGWQIANPVSRRNPDEITRYPFAVLTTNSPQALKTVTFTVSSDESATKVKDAIVIMNGVKKKTSVGGVATIDVPNGYNGEWTVMKGDVIRHGTLENVTGAKSITIKNFKEIEAV